jgi:two-component system response regulator HydG
MKPFRPDQLSLVMEKVRQQKKRASEYDYVKGRLEKMTRFDNIIGQSLAMQEIFALIPEVAQSDASVLLTGETGTGKELVARAIHAQSPRANLPFIAINCGAMPESLLESELFGHEKGAFTHAARSRRGFLEIVSGGTLFFDEVGEISKKMQMDLLRALEEKLIYRVGSRTAVPVDFRLVSATSQPLDKIRSEGSFREDFYYRIGVIEIQIPPLRDRREDVPLLVEHFLRKYGQETTKKVERVTPRAVERLMQYVWPGNVRELQNAIERAVVLSRGNTLDVGDFAFLTPSALNLPQETGTLKEREKAYVYQVLCDNDWNITRSAAILGINRVTLHKKIKRYGFERQRADA